MYGCLNAWTDLVDRRALCRRVMGKLISRCNAQTRTHVYLRLWQHMIAQRDDDHNEHLRDIVLQRYVGRLQHTTHARIFFGWLEAVRQLKVNRHRVKVARQRWCRRVLFASLSSWGFFVRRRVSCRRVMAHLARRHTYLGWSTWTEHVNDGRRKDADVARNEIAARTRQNHINAFAKCIARVFRASQMYGLLRSFGRLHGYGRAEAVKCEMGADIARVEQKRVETAALMTTRFVGHDESRRRFAAVQICRFLSFHAKCVCFGAFEAWKSSTVQRRNRPGLWMVAGGLIAAKIQCHRCDVSRLWHRWRGRILHMSLKDTEVASSKAKMRMVIQRWRKQELSAVLGQWAAMVDARVLCRTLLSRILRRQKTRTRADALERWYAFTETSCHNERDAHRADTIVKRCAKRISQLSIARAFDGWSKAVAGVKINRHRVQMVVARWKRREMGSTFASWVGMVETRVAKRGVMVSMLRRLSQKALYAAYGTWRAHTGALVAQENEAARLEKVVHRCALRMQSLKLAAAFAGWVHAKINARSYRHLLGVALSRWQRRTASSCFAAWIELVESRIAGREVMVRMLRRLSQRQIYAAWRSWRGYFHRSRRKTHTTIV